MSIKSSFKGWAGEKLTQFGMWLGLDEKEYHRFHDLIVPDKSGATTQIDHVIVSCYAVFVLEVKNMKGWIFGAEDNKQWTQSLLGGKKFKFQNPLRQNYRHIKCLSEYLELPESAFESVVFFIPDQCVFKTKMPDNVKNRRLIPYIRDFQTPRLSDDEVWHVCNQLHGLKGYPSLNRWTHLRSLEERHAKAKEAKAKARAERTINKAETITKVRAEVVNDGETPAKTCPRCGGALVVRKAKRGERAGKEFWGCSAFPKCRYIINI